MKRDIRINFGVIDDVITNISDYYDALSDIDISLRNIKHILGENTGKSIDSLTSNYDELTADIEDCKSELSEVRQLLSNYLNEMGSYIQPVYRSSIMQVDRNDVWANLHSIENSVMGLVQSIAHSRNNCAGSFTFDEEKVKNERANYEIIEGINSDVNTTLNKLNSKIDELWNIYNNKIVPFENTDDAFKGKAKETYFKIAGLGDIVGDFIYNFGEFAGDIFSGIVNSIFDLVKGVVSLIKGTICYLGSTAVVLVSQPFGDAPSWAKDYFNNTNNLIGNILNDPILIVEGIAQEASDIIDQKGIAYSTGYVAGMIAGTKGLDKITKATKGLIINKKTPNIKVADDVVNQASKSELSRIDYLRNKYGTLTSEQINNRINLRGAVNDEIERLYKLGITNKELGPAVAGVLDPKTGKYYFGINKGKVPKELHPLIKERIDNMPPEIHSSYEKTSGAGSHAEVYALNEALLANPTAKLDEIMVYVVRSGKKLKPRGLPMPRCPHCEYITNGANYFPEVLKYGK